MYRVLEIFLTREGSELKVSNYSESQLFKVLLKCMQDELWNQSEAEKPPHFKVPSQVLFPGEAENFIRITLPLREESFFSSSRCRKFV